MSRILAEANGKAAPADASLSSISLSSSAVAELAQWLARGDTIRTLSKKHLILSARLAQPMRSPARSDGPSNGYRRRPHGFATMVISTGPDCASATTSCASTVRSRGALGRPTMRTPSARSQAWDNLSKGKAVDALWDASLAMVMQQHRIFIAEETLAGSFVAGPRQSIAFPI